jgi:serine/threonine-protein kinase
MRPAVPPLPFVLGDEIGRGGVGRVLEAWDPVLGRTVAVKGLHEGEERRPQRVARFVAEAKLTARLEHPHVVPVHALHHDGEGAPWLVMKRVHGKTLREVVAEAERAPSEPAHSVPALVGLFLPIGRALAHAHARGVVHRDLKPENVMVGEHGQVYVMDWGLGRTADGTDLPAQDLPWQVGEGLTQEGASLGTPGYQSPEQARGDLPLVGPASDVWSLGAILYELLTLTRAYRADNLWALVMASVEGPPEDPRRRAPNRGIDEEIAAICLHALTPEPERRPVDAGVLVALVERWLSGAGRRTEADREAVAARRALTDWFALAEEERQLQARQAELEVLLPPWLPMAEREEFLDLQLRLRRLPADRERLWTELAARVERARELVPGHPAAGGVLAEAAWAQVEDAEAQGDDVRAQSHLALVRRVDDGRHGHRLRGEGQVRLRSDPDGATVEARPFLRDEIVWTLGDPVDLGRTPIDTPLPMGSWLLTLRAPGRRDTTYPVRIGRCATWDGGPPVPLLPDEALGDELLYVPAGPFRFGGDAQALEPQSASEPWLDGFRVSRFPVTMGEYLAFLNALHPRDPEQAWRRSPRRESGYRDDAGQYLRRPAPGESFEIPERDSDGDEWDPRWPVSSISWEDAQAFVAWRTSVDGQPWSLPAERQWEKAARGVDGRTFPWGDVFDATLCTMRYSRPGRPRCRPVGESPGDVSVYGVRDMAGTIREWCADPEFLRARDRRVVRGGSWNHNPDACRCASRLGTSWQGVGSYYGFRLVLPLA